MGFGCNGHDLWPGLRNQSLAAEASDSDTKATSCHIPVVVNNAAFYP